MAVDYFLKLSGVQGESLDSKHTNEIELLSWSWGASNPTNIAGSGMSAGKVSMSEITISKLVDKSSPKLLELCVTGKHVADATLTCRKSTGGKNPDDFLTIKLSEVYVSGFQAGGSSGEKEERDSLSLSYGKINYDYKMQKPDGSLVSAGNIEYDLRKGQQTA